MKIWIKFFIKAIYLKNFYDIYPLNRQSTFRLFAENKIGFSFGEDFGTEDYISTNGGFFWSPSIGIKKSSGKNIGNITDDINNTVIKGPPLQNSI